MAKKIRQEAIINIRVPTVLALRIQVEADQSGRNPSQVVREVLGREFASHETPGKN